MSAVSTIIKHCATGIDGQTYDYVRVGTIIGTIAIIAFTAYHLFAHRQFDVLSFGAALGSLYGGSGIGVGSKARTEPPMQPKADNPDA